MPSTLEPPEAAAIHVWKVALAAGGREAARAALGDLLAAYLGTAPVLGTEPGGKPRLAADPGRLSFNLSHSAGLALVAVAAGGVPVGVDVELVKPRRDLARLAARWLGEADAAAVAGAPPGEERERIFYAAWTRHEARAKCTGAGLAGPPPGPSVRAWPVALGPETHATDIRRADAGYAAAIALDTSAAALRGATLTEAPPILLRDAACRR